MLTSRRTTLSSAKRLWSDITRCPGVTFKSIDIPGDLPSDVKTLLRRSITVNNQDKRGGQYLNLSIANGIR